MTAGVRRVGAIFRLSGRRRAHNARSVEAAGVFLCDLISSSNLQQQLGEYRYCAACCAVAEAAMDRQTGVDSRLRLGLGLRVYGLPITRTTKKKCGRHQDRAATVVKNQMLLICCFRFCWVFFFRPSGHNNSPKNACRRLRSQPPPPLRCRQQQQQESSRSIEGVSRNQFGVKV